MASIKAYLLIQGLTLKYVLPSFSDYFFSDSEDTGCIDCGICVVHAGNNDFGCWQYTTADNNFRCLPSKPEMSEFPGIESLNTRSRWSTYDVKNDVEKTCQIEAETKFNNLTCLQVNFYQIMFFLFVRHQCSFLSKMACVTLICSISDLT